jgi:hypothetical protein
MKCASPYPDGSYQECQLDLGHSGQHTYPGLKWPRLEPAELDPAIADLLDETMPPRTWGVDERSYPVVVVATTVYIKWVDAESEDKALAYWADDPTDLGLDNADSIDCSLEIQRPDQWQRQDALRATRLENKVGPLVKCPGCDAQALRREWMHNPLRKCHGPIEWRQIGNGRAYREYRSTPVHYARQAVSA